mmetsp:Transcript_120149/g.347173  ORF Transcript_120149/g.347173 Transcript_120149/m.347173 type:complete len:285 (-) Transcript_120149:317-1171(-)
MLPSSVASSLNHLFKRCTKFQFHASTPLAGANSDAMGSSTATARTLQCKAFPTTIGRTPRIRTLVTCPRTCSVFPTSMTSTGPLLPGKRHSVSVCSGSSHVCGRKPRFQNDGISNLEALPSSVTGNLKGFILSLVDIRCRSRAPFGISVTIHTPWDGGFSVKSEMSCQGEIGPTGLNLKKRRYCSGVSGLPNMYVLTRFGSKLPGRLGFGVSGCFAASVGTTGVSSTAAFSLSRAALFLAAAALRAISSASSFEWTSKLLPFTCTAPTRVLYRKSLASCSIAPS